MNYPEIVDSLIAANREHREEKMARFVKGMHPIGWAIECCTVLLDIGRGVGKTAYIRDRARPWDVVIVRNETHRRQSYQNAPHIITLGEQRWQFERFLGRDVVPRIVYVDDASAFTKEQIDGIYATFARHPDQTFVLLG